MMALCNEAQNSHEINSIPHDLQWNLDRGPRDPQLRMLLGHENIPKLCRYLSLGILNWYSLFEYFSFNIFQTVVFCIWYFTQK